MREHIAPDVVLAYSEEFTQFLRDNDLNAGEALMVATFSFAQIIKGAHLCGAPENELRERIDDYANKAHEYLDAAVAEKAANEQCVTPPEDSA